MNTHDALIIGAVAYDPKVVTIWEGFRAWFAEHGLDFDFVLYSNYERQVAAHFDGVFDVAWNSPLAWLQSERIADGLGRTASAIVMRDTDRDLTSVFTARTDGPITSLEQLRGGTLGVGAKDSPQATMIPQQALVEAGLQPGKDVEIVCFDVALGKHGDHVGGERDACQALMRGDVDAVSIIDGNHLAFVAEGTLPQGATRLIHQTAPYDHCNFTVLDGAPTAAVETFAKLLLSMSYEDPKVRALLDLEGLKQWLPGRTEGYAQLAAAIDRDGSQQAFIDGVVADHR